MAGRVPIEQVSDLLREVAAEAVMPRFRRLAEAEVRLKSPGEEVTIADEEAERLLTAGLSALLPGSRVIGEEAVSARPELMQGLGEGTVFVVDPVDGTANFIKGSPCFSMMVALLREGEAIASWMLSPATGRSMSPSAARAPGSMASASGSGSHRNGPGCAAAC